MNKKQGMRIVFIILLSCVLLVGLPLMAAENVLKPTDWSFVLSTTLEGGILDLSGLGTNTSSTRIEVPTGIKNLTIKGDSSKVYDGLIIEAKDSRGAVLSLTIENLNIINGRIDIARTTGGDYLYIKGNNRIQSNNSAAVLIEGQVTGETANRKLTIDAVTTGARLTAIGGINSAGIGGKENGTSGGDIVIKGGTIIAQGGNGSAGIGAASQRSVNSITITDNAIIESSKGGNGGAGIGGSQSAPALDYIEVSGNASIEYAKGGNGGAGIGSGAQSGVKFINIWGGTIGKEDDPNVSDDIEQNGARGGQKGAGIGGGANDTADMTINIQNTTIKYARGGDGAAGIGGGYERGATINIKSGAVIIKAIGGKSGAGIGCGPNGAQKTITIEAGSLIKLAQGGDDGAGIGGGQTRSAIINITGGNIEHAKGGINAAGIGCGSGNNDANAITISGGVIYAEGGSGTATNDIGAANYNDVPGGKKQEDAKYVPVNIIGGTVFVANNTTIGKTAAGSHVNYVLVAYQNYDPVSRTGVKYAGATIRLRTSGGMDKSLVCNAEGRTAFSWEDQAQSLTGYWFQIDDIAAGQIYVGYKAENDPGKWNQVMYDSNNNVITSGTPERIVTEIPIIYTASTTSAPPTQIVKPTGSGNKVVPYSTSTVAYTLDIAAIKTKDPDIITIKKINASMDLSIPDNGSRLCSVSFDPTQATGGILVNTDPVGTPNKYDFVPKGTEFTLTQPTLTNEKIKFEYTGAWIEGNNYKVVAYIPTKGVSEGGTEKPLDTYKTDYVSVNYAIPVKITDVTLTVDRLETLIAIIGGVPTTVGTIVQERTINIDESNIMAQFYDIPNIK